MLIFWACWLISSSWGVWVMVTVKQNTHEDCVQVMLFEIEFCCSFRYCLYLTFFSNKCIYQSYQFWFRNFYREIIWKTVIYRSENNFISELPKFLLLLYSIWWFIQKGLDVIKVVFCCFLKSFVVLVICHQLWDSFKG